MSGFYKQSAAAYLDLGPFISSTDGKSRLTALSLLKADIRLSKNGGTIAAKSHASACTHLSAAVYRCPLNATDFNTPGRLRVEAVHASALAVWETITVLPANIYDSLIGGTDKIEVDLTHVLGVLQTTGLNGIKTNTSAIAAKLPSKAYLTGTTNSDGDVQASEMTGNFPGSVASVAGAVASVTGNVGGNVAGSVGSVTGAVGSVTGNVGGNVAGSVASVVTKTGYALTSDYDAAKNAAPRSSLSAVATTLASVKVDTSAVAAVDFAALTAAVGALDASAISDLAADLAVVDGIVDQILGDTSAIPAMVTKVNSIKVDTSAVAAVDFDALTSAIGSLDTAALGAMTSALAALDASALASLPTAADIRAEMETTGGKLERVHRRLFGKVTMTSGLLKVYDDTGALVVTTQILSDDGTTQTQGAAT